MKIVDTISFEYNRDNILTIIYYSMLFSKGFRSHISNHRSDIFSGNSKRFYTAGFRICGDGIRK